MKMVTSGMYVTATKEPTIQVLKYKLRNQSCCTEPELTRKSQKQSSSKCVTLWRPGMSTGSPRLAHVKMLRTYISSDHDIVKSR